MTTTEANLEGNRVSLREVGDLILEQDLKFERREWKAERIAWIVMALIIVAALLGLFGAGPLSLTTAENDEGTLKVQYERFGRRGAPATITFDLVPTPADEDTATLAVDRGYLEGFRIDQIAPQPQDVTAEGDRLIYTFAVEPTAETMTVTFDVTMGALGPHSGAAATGGSNVTLSHFFYP